MLRIFQCIQSCTAAFDLQDKVFDALYNHQNDPKKIKEYAKMDYAKNISRILFIFNIISIIILCLNIIGILVVGKSDLVKMLLFAYSIFQIPVLLIAFIPIVPIIKKYKIYFFTRYYEMGEFVRKNRM